MIEEVVLP